MRYLLLVLLFNLPAPVQAQTATVLSGEHVDFSRLVVQLDQLSNWTFGRVPGGYELRFDAPNLNLDTSRVFTRIPRDRIFAVISVGSGRLFVQLACDCAGDAFEIRQGRLVIDIKDEKPDQDSPFEIPLPSLENGLAWQSDTRSPADLSNLLYLTQQAIIAAQEPGVTNLPSTPDLSQNVQIIATDVESEHPYFPNNIPEDEVAVVTVQTDNTPSLAATNTMPLLTPWPIKLPLPNKSKTNRINETEKQLIQQFSRAAAQGLFSIKLPEIPEQLQTNTMDQNPAVNSLTLSGAAVNETGPEMFQNLRVQTAADRDAPNNDKGQPRTNEGYDCLPESIFQIADWAPEGGIAGFLMGMRSSLVGEFDRPDTQMILALTKRYLYLGYGAEAKLMLNSFSVDIPNSDILSQMASILDSEALPVKSKLGSQISCSTPAALWAVLATPEFPAGSDVDTKFVLRYFSELPPHLRRLLGPDLAERFLQSDDLITASAIRDIVDRTANNRDAAFSMMQAQIAAHDGDLQSAIMQFEAAAISNGVQAPRAMVNLINAKLENKQEITQKTALLAEAMASEYAGTDTERQLTLAAIKAFATSQTASDTLDRIKQAQQNGTLEVEEARELAIDAHLSNVKNSTDEIFVKTVYQYPPMLTGATLDSQQALWKIAARLVDLGLPQKAIHLYDSATYPYEQRDSLLLARAELGLENPKSVSDLLANITTPEANNLLALASEMQKDYAQAAQFFRKAQMPEAQASATWRSGELALLELENSDPRYVFSQLAANRTDPPPSLVMAENRIENDAITHDPKTIVAVTIKPPTIVASNELITRSQETRNAIRDLLQSR